MMTDQEIPQELRTTTRQGMPQLWGVSELTRYANQVAEALGKEKLHPGRAWSWDQVEGFPEPVARLAMGKVYVAEEVMAFVDARLAVDRHRTTPLSPELKAQISGEYGLMTAEAAATKHGVSRASVWRVWSPSSR